jgi:hypothetical protein
MLLQASEERVTSYEVDQKEFKKTSYHRALVNEHSIELIIEDKKYIFSDYKSEELGDNTAELSVQITKDGVPRDTLYCDIQSTSALAKLKDTKTSSY